MKKQTAVEWFHQKTWNLKIQLEFSEISIGEYASTYSALYEEAKEMEKEQRIKNIKDYNIVVTEFLLNPLFNLEHSQHAIACEKLSDIRNKFISNHIINYNETYGGNK
jgi:hypothetical protein